MNFRTLIPAVAGLALSLSTAACTVEETPARTVVDLKIEEGTRLLEAGKFRSARATFHEVVAAETGLAPASCSANYGYTLAIAFELVGGLMDAGDWDGDDNGNDLSNGVPMPLSATPDTQYTEEIDGYISSFLLPAVSGMIGPMETALAHVIAGGCEFTVPNGIPLETAGRTHVTVGTVFGQAEARLLLGVLHILHGGINWISGYDLRIDYVRALDLVDEALARDDEDLLLRGLADALGHSPTFLALHPDRMQRIPTARGKLLEGLAALQDGLHTLFRQANGPEARRRALGYVDANLDGKVGPGDELWIGIIDAHPTITFGDFEIRNYPIGVGTSFGPPAESIVFAVLNEDFLSRVDALLDRVAENLEGKGGLFNIAEVNTLVGGLPLVPGVVAVDLSRLFPTDLSDAVPLRRFLPARGDYNPPGNDADYFGDGYHAFLVEVELNTLDTAHYMTEGTGPVEEFCYVCGPGEHFRPSVYGTAATYFTMSAESASVLGSAEVPGLPDDCVAPSSGRYTYAWMQDPTFNGMLYIDLAALDEEDRCANDAPYAGKDPGNAPVPRDEAIPASQYSFNKVLNLLIGFPDVTGMF